MPICKTTGKDGSTGLGVNCEFTPQELGRMSAGQVFERISLEFWTEFVRMNGVPADEDLDVTYRRSFLDKPRTLH